MKRMLTYGRLVNAKELESMWSVNAFQEAILY